MNANNDVYKTVFNSYPDVVNIKQMCEMLGGISSKTGYRLLHSGKIKHFSIGRSVRIPKICIIDFALGNEMNSVNCQ